MHPITLNYALRSEDIPRMLCVFERVLGTPITPQHLDALVKNSGFATYATFVQAIQKSPVFLTTGTPPGQYTLHKAPLSALVAAGMAWTDRHDPAHAYLLSPNERLTNTLNDGGDRSQYLTFLRTHSFAIHNFYTEAYYCASLNPQDTTRLLHASLVLVASPANQTSILHNITVNPHRDCTTRPWVFNPLTFPREPYAGAVPNGHERVPLDCPMSLAIWMQQHRLVFYSDDDKQHFYKVLQEHGFYDTLIDAITVRKTLEILDKTSSFSLFQAGYYGFCYLDIPHEDVLHEPSSLQTTTLSWLHDITAFLRDYSYEYCTAHRPALPFDTTTTRPVHDQIVFG